MDIQAKKLELIQWIAGINDPKLISQFVDLKQAKSEEDHLIVESIEKGILDIEEGKIKNHQEIKKKYDKWL